MAKSKMIFGYWQYECTAVKVIFCIRAFLWIVALGFTFHWTRFSFDLYKQGIYDPHDYATILRPVLYRDLIISVSCIVVCFVLRRIAMRIKEVKEMDNVNNL